MGNLRKVIASISLVAILSTFAVTNAAFAKSPFTDVGDKHWFTTEGWDVKAKDAGIFTKTTAMPDASVIRADMAMMVAAAAGLNMTSLEAFPSGVFTDVKSTDYWYKSLQAGRQANVFSEKPKFDATGVTNRAQAAKVIVTAFGLTPATPKTKTLSDVNLSYTGADAWMNNIYTAYCYGLVKAGTFNPGANVTRAEFAKMLIVAKDAPTLKAECTKGTDVVPPVKTGGGALDISVADSSPSEASVPALASGVNLGSFTFKSNGSAESISSIKFTRTGLGDTNDFTSVYVYADGVRLRSGKTISSDDNTVEFSNLGIKIAKDSSVEVSLKGDIAGTASSTPTGSVTGGEENYFGIASDKDVTTDADSVTGLPVTAEKVKLLTTVVSTITVANGATLSKPTLGQSSAKVGSFKVTAGTNNAVINGVTLVQNGSISNSYLKNFVVKESVSGKEMGTADALVGDKLVVQFNEPYTVTKSQNRTFDVYADTTGGKSTDTVRLYIEEAGDLMVEDAQYNFGAYVTNNFGSSSAYCLGAGSNTCPTNGSFQAGAVTFADNGPVAGDIAKNTTQTAFFNFAVTADRSITFKDYDLVLEQPTSSDGTDLSGVMDGTDVDLSTGGNQGSLTLTKGNTVELKTQDTTTPDLAAGDIIKTADGAYVKLTTVASQTDVTGTVMKSGTVSTSEAFTVVWDSSVSSGKIKNLKLIDSDSGAVIYSLATPTGYNLASDDFDVNAETKHLTLKADVDTSITAGNAYKFGFDFTGTNYVKDNDANEYLASGDIVGGNLFGKTQTITATSLTVTKSSVPVSKTFVKGQQLVDLLGTSYTASNSGDVTVSKVVARLGADTGTTFNQSYGDTAANTVVDKVYLYKGNAKVAGPVGMTLVGTIGSGGYYKAEFQNLSEVIKSGHTENYKFVVDLKNTITATRYVMATMASSDVTASDSQSNSVDATLSATLNTVNTTTVADGVPDTYMTVASSGTLSMKSEGSPDAAIAVAGQSNVLMAKYKFTATNEAYTVQKFDVVMDTDGDFTDAPSGDTSTQNDVQLVTVKYKDAAGVEQTQTGTLSSGKASFSGATFYVPKDASSYITVYTDVNTIAGGATTGAVLHVGLSEYQDATNTFKAVGESSSETKAYDGVTITAAASDVKTFTVRKTMPTVTAATGLSTSLLDGQRDIYGFKVTADAGAAVALKRVAINTNFSTGITVNNLQVLKGDTDITANVSIRNAVGANLKLGGSNLATEGGSATSDVIYITWDKAAADESVTSAGNADTYIVRANVSGSASGDSISSYISYDSVSSANLAVGGLRTSTATNGETAAATANGTAVVIRARLADNTSLYLDLNGNGAYDAATEPKFTATPATATFAANAIIPGNIYIKGDNSASDCSDAGDFLFIDVDGSGAYNLSTDLKIAIATTTSTAAACNSNSAAKITYRLRAGASGKVYFDINDNGAFSNEVDFAVTDPSNGALTANSAIVGTGFNFVWSDNSDNSHATTTTDWTNGYLVRNLLTGVQNTLSR